MDSTPSRTGVTPTKFTPNAGGALVVPTNVTDPARVRSTVTDPEDAAEAIAFAATQRPPNTASELNRYRRDEFHHF